MEQLVLTAPSHYNANLTLPILMNTYMTATHRRLPWGQKILPGCQLLPNSGRVKTFLVTGKQNCKTINDIFYIYKIDFDVYIIYTD